MAEKNEVKQEVGVVDIVNSIADKQRATAIDAIHDMLFAKSNDAMADYKKVVANTYFQEPTGDEEPSNETDNGTN